MAHGHPDPFGYSLDKFVLLANALRKRLDREEDRRELRTLQLLRLAHRSGVDAAGWQEYKKELKRLSESLYPAAPKPAGTNLLRRLIAAGRENASRRK